MKYEMAGVRAPKKPQPEKNKRRFTRLDFSEGQKVKLSENYEVKSVNYMRTVDPALTKKRTVRGKIVQITDFLIVLKTQNYKECFKFSDFTSGIVEVM